VISAGDPSSATDGKSSRTGDKTTPSAIISRCCRSILSKVLFHRHVENGWIHPEPLREQHGISNCPLHGRGRNAHRDTVPDPTKQTAETAFIKAGEQKQMNSTDEGCGKSYTVHAGKRCVTQTGARDRPRSRANGAAKFDEGKMEKRWCDTGRGFANSWACRNSAGEESRNGTRQRKSRARRSRSDSSDAGRRRHHRSRHAACVGGKQLTMTGASGAKSAGIDMTAGTDTDAREWTSS